MINKLVHKSIILSTVAVMSLTSLSFNSYAKEKDDKGIGAIKLKINADYSAGEVADESSFNVSTSTEGVSVESFELLEGMATKEDGEWSKYDTPILLINLSADEGYYFNKAGSKSGWSFSDENARYMSSSVSSDKYEVELKVMMESLKGDIGNPYNLHWSNTSVGAWTKGYKNNKFKVVLYYGDDDKVFNGETSNTYYDFRDHMHKEGNYYFTVQGIKGDLSTDEVESPYTSISDVEANELAHGVANNSVSNTMSNDFIKTENHPKMSGDTSAFTGETPGWHQTGDKKWYYIRSNGSKAASNWELIDGKWYMFDLNGIMMTGVKTIGGAEYYLADSGEMLTGWQTVKNVDYYYTPSGAKATNGWYFIDNNWYLFDGNGVKQVGWKYINNKWYYLNQDGTMKTGWFTDEDGKVYFLYDSGEMATGNGSAFGVPHVFAETGELIE